jgi:FixJ family two-component response regulator
MSSRVAETPIVAIVDDDPSVRRSLRSLFLSSGFVVRAFTSGPTFLAWPDLDEASCLVLDLAMPEMSGSEVLSRLRAGRRLMPFVVLTASADLGDVIERLLEDGAIACLRKPASGPELLRAVREAVGTNSKVRVGK